MEQQCQSILERVLNIAPVLSARICPIGCDDKTLSSLCVSEKQAEELQLELAKYSSKTHCTLCKKESQSTEPRTFWKIDFKKSTYQLTGLHFCCGLCCKLQFFSETVNNPTEELIQHFLQINHKFESTEDTHLTPEQRVLFQQCYSLSYSLQIFSNYAQFRLLDNHGNPFSDKTQLGKLVKELCAPPQEEAAPKKSSPKPQQRKTKKRPSLTKPSPQPKKQFKAK